MIAIFYVYSIIIKTKENFKDYMEDLNRELERLKTQIEYYKQIQRDNPDRKLSRVIRDLQIKEAVLEELLH